MGAASNCVTHAPAIVASSYHPHVGGVEELVRQLARHQRKRGMYPVIATMRWPKDLPTEEDHDRIPVRRYSFRVAERRPRQALTAVLTRKAITRRMVADLRAFGVDLVHVQCVSANGWYALRAAQMLDVPLVVSLQGELTMDASAVYQRSSVLPNLLRELLLVADVVTACSSATLIEAEAFTGVDVGDRARVIYNGVSLSDFDVLPVKRPRPYVLGIGRLVPQKGFDVLLRAWSKSALPDFDLVIAGDGVARAELEQLAADLNVDAVFLGAVTRRDVPGLFRGAQAFVLPSRHEPMGIVSLEAMAAGTPVVATRVGGVPELVHDGETGVLVPPDDVQALSAALQRVLRDADLRSRLAASASAHVERFDWSLITDEYLDAYEVAARRRAK